MDFVNNEDQVIGTCSKKEIYERHLLHRIVHVWVFGSDGRLLIQKRSRDCHFCPLHWSMAAGGHVDAGEDYETAAKRELKEELGIEALLTFVEKTRYLDPRGSEKFISIFKTVHDGPFVYPADEVDSIRWVNKKDFEKILANEPCHPQLLKYADRFKPEV